MVYIELISSSKLVSFPILGSGGSCLDCTPDEMAALAQEIQERSNLVKSHTYHLVKYKNSFIGRELVEWLIENKETCK